MTTDVIVAVLIAASAIVASFLAWSVALRYRHRMVPVGWRSFVAMGLGTVAIAAFYLGIAHANYHGDSVLPFVPYSRILWVFIVIATAMMAIGVLIIKQDDGDG